MFYRKKSRDEYTRGQSSEYCSRIIMDDWVSHGHHRGCFQGKDSHWYNDVPKGEKAVTAIARQLEKFEFQVLNARDMAEVGRIIGECGEWAEGLKDRNL